MSFEGLLSSEYRRFTQVIFNALSNDKALKITWVKRLCSNDNRPGKLIPLSLLSKRGDKRFHCNYNIKYLPINEHLQSSTKV